MEMIARAAKVSRSTVSRALRDDPQISPATRKKIRSLANELHYRPNPLVATLMEGVRSRRVRSYAGTLAIITSELKDGSSWPWSAYRAGIGRRAAKCGYSVEEFSTMEFGSDGRRLSEILHARGIIGLVLAPYRRLEGPGAVRLEWEKFTAVTLGYSVAKPNVNRVCHRNYRGVRMAARELARRGYKRIGLCIEPHYDERTDHSYQAGFLVFQQELDAADRVPVFREKIDSRVDRRFLEWTGAHRPDALLLTRGFIDPLARIGVRFPENMGGALLDVDPRSHDWAGIDHKSELIGAMATDLLIAQIQRNERGLPGHPLIQSVEGAWVDGSSARPISFRKINSKSLSKSD